MEHQRWIVQPSESLTAITTVLALSSYFPEFSSPTATLEVVGNTGNTSSEKADVGFGSSYLNAFSPQDLGRCQ
jgi:hypothetical protein